MRYDWDEEKYFINKTKHGIRFEDAVVIWADQNALEFYDPDNSSVEDRYIRIGLNPFKGILLVIFCERSDGDVIRIISARKATLEERNEYERQLPVE